MGSHGWESQPARRAPQSLPPGRGREPDYGNPYASDVERVWFDGRVVYALDCGELDEQGKFGDDKEPEYVGGQYNIYDSVPGMEDYSPPWQFNYVVVERDYEPNTLRSEADCLEGGYRIERSTVAEN